MHFWKYMFSDNRLFCSSATACKSIYFLAFFLVVAGCQPPEDQHPDINLTWQIEPDPPGVGMAALHIILTDSTEQRLAGAEIKLEGNMSHPGMKPFHATMDEVEPGKYAADIEFTMGGDWFFLVESTLPDERVLEHQVNVPGVRSQ
ncbi:MAG: FixH family protein [Balneolaceae bacterium]